MGTEILTALCTVGVVYGLFLVWSVVVRPLRSSSATFTAQRLPRDFARN